MMPKSLNILRIYFHVIDNGMRVFFLPEIIEGVGFLLFSYFCC